jgi:hypothetical protein
MTRSAVAIQPTFFVLHSGWTELLEEPVINKVYGKDSQVKWYEGLV